MIFKLKCLRVSVLMSTSYFLHQKVKWMNERKM